MHSTATMSYGLEVPVLPIVLHIYDHNNLANKELSPDKETLEEYWAAASASISLDFLHFFQGIWFTFFPTIFAALLIYSHNSSAVSASLICSCSSLVSCHLPYNLI